VAQAVKPGPKKPSTVGALFFGRESLARQTAQSDAQKSHAKRMLASKPIQPQQDVLVSPRQRALLTERVQSLGIRHARVLAAINAIPRHQFLDAGLASRAYDDLALPIGHQQTISRPSVVARMIELALSPGISNGAQRQGKVLEIGTGCGYAAAVLSLVFAKVVSIERIRALHELAARNITGNGWNNISLVFGDGILGAAKEGPFDAVIIAAAGIGIPESLLRQLSIAGRLVAPVVQADGSQSLQLVERVSQQDWRMTRLEPASFVPLRSGVKG
jgi:protein-L-isoaspartate(D-aspartate) O-methyltransferase